MTVQSSRAAEKHPHAAGEEVRDEPAMLKSSGRGAPIIPDPQSRSPAVRFVMAAGASFVAFSSTSTSTQPWTTANLSKFGFVARLFVGSRTC